jgi:hypothetical protein
MLQKKWLDLQLFAEGGEGGGEGSSVGGESAASPADDGQARLRELGVPENKIRKRASAKADAATQTVQPETHVEQDAAVQQPAEAKRMTWDEIMADPEYNKHMQDTVKARNKKAREEIEAERAQIKAERERYVPMLEVLASRYKLDPQNPDVDALIQAVNNDKEFYEQKALEMGVPVETAMQIDQQKREQERNKVAEQRRAEEEAFDAHIAKLEQQGEALKAVFPQFDLRTELQNPTFKRLTAPGVGLSVEDAYHAVHRKEIAAAQSAAVAQKTARQISDTIIAGQRRPTENGTSARAASVTTFDYSKASASQRNAIKQQIRDAAARGVKLRPEDIIL